MGGTRTAPDADAADPDKQADKKADAPADQVDEAAAKPSKAEKKGRRMSVKQELMENEKAKSKGESAKGTKVKTETGKKVKGKKGGKQGKSKKEQSASGSSDSSESDEN